MLILTHPDDASPKVLAFSLKHMFVTLNVAADISFEINVLRRINTFNYKSKTLGATFLLLKRKLQFLIHDFKFIKSLNNYDAIIISECTPNSFWLDYHAIEKLKSILHPKPVLLFEVYYLGNTPFQINKLIKKGNPTMERYDWHLAVTDITEVHSKPDVPWSCIGLDLKSMGLKPQIKEEFFAIVDFEQKGYEANRRMQIEALDKLGIPYVEFKERMPLVKIRDYYSRASLIFVQSPEAFGVPIAECLSYGTAVFTPQAEWLMSWRLISEKQIISNNLPNCFFIYKNFELLVDLLSEFKNSYQSKETPKLIFDSFISNYPHFYKGDTIALHHVIERIKNQNFK